MAEEHPGAWFGFGFCGFGQALGSGRGPCVHSPEPLRVPGAETCHVSASWSYTAVVTRGDRAELSGSASGAIGDCADAWASEAALVVLRVGAAHGAELQVWSPERAPRGEPLWTHAVVREPARRQGGAQAGVLPLLPGACAYVSPRPPFYRPLAPELRARRLELGAEHAVLLGEAGQVFSWGSGRHGQLGHGTLEAELEPRPLEALQGLPMAEVAAGGWHSVCVSETGDIYVWGWNESGQLALPTRSLAEEGKTVQGEATVLTLDGPDLKGAAGGEDGGPAPFISIQSFPALLDLPLGSEAIKASCGSRHTAVVTRSVAGSSGGLVCTCGRCPAIPKLGLPGDLTPVAQPGRGGQSPPVQFTAWKPNGGMGELYTWGWGKYGQLGHKDTASLDHPCRVQYFVEKQLRVKAVTCGLWNTYVYAV